MFSKRSLPVAGVLIAALLLAAPAFALVPLPDSVAPVQTPPPVGAVSPLKATVTRQNLTAAEEAAPLVIEVALKMRNFDELRARIARGERISAQEMTARYEPAAADYDAVTAWVESQGLTIVRRDDHRVAVFARGSISQIEKAFGVKFARVAFKGEEFTSAITVPSVSAAISPLLIGIDGLQPHLRKHKHIVTRQGLKDSLSGAASYFPKQIAQAYNVAALYNNDINGSGQVIAIVIDTFPAVSDLETFWQDAGVNQSIGNIEFIQAVPGTLPSPSGEETLDTEWSSSMAPGARVRVYAATDLADADLDQTYQQVYDDVTNHPELGIHQMSMSYGAGERDGTSKSQVETDDVYYAELTAAGVTVFASSGDDGSTPGSGGTGDESGEVQVDNPASDPNVTGVGGTTLVLDSGNNITSEKVWNNSSGASGGGLSIYFPKPDWQTGTGVVSGTGREVPDVAGSADPNYGAIIVEGGDEQTVGGTSWSSPTWAALCALMNQARADLGESSLGLLQPYIYPLLTSPNYPGNYANDFHDITTGSNVTPYSGSNQYKATAGYDLCTGLGSPRTNPLAQLLANTASLIGVEDPVAVEEVAPGQSAAFSVSVSGASPTYQWQIMPVGSSSWTNLTDDGTFSGSVTATLNIANATTAMSGDQFQCLVTAGANTVTTAPDSVLVVETPLKISTLAGTSGETGLENGAPGLFNYPSGVAADSSGNIYVADYGNNQIREVTPGGTVSTPYGNVDGESGSANGSGNTATFTEPNGVAIDGSNNIFVADTGNNLIREITGGVVSTLAGTSGEFNTPEGVAVDSSGNVYVADTGNDVIRKITPGGTVSILAGKNGVPGYADGAATTVARFNGPAAVAVDSLGNVYVADFNNNVVRKIAGGMVSTVAGQASVSGYLDGLGTSALFNAPVGVAVDSGNNVYISDSLVPAIGSTAAGNCLLRKLTPSGVVSTLAGEAGVAGSNNGTGSGAEFYSIQGAVETASGQIYIADTYNQLIRSGTTGVVQSASNTRIIALSGNMNFGNVALNGTANSTLTISNNGNSTMTVTGISYPAGFSGDYSSGTIGAGDAQDVTVTFSPTAAATYGGNIVVAADETSGSDSIAASGTGVVVTVEPAVATASATNIGGASATLNGTVNPEGDLTAVYFQYGTSTNYTEATSGSSAGSGTAQIKFSAPVSSLEPNTTYYYRAVATSGTQTVYGDGDSFKTEPFVTVTNVATGDVVAGLTGAEFSTVANPAINDLDYLAFQATLATGAGGVTAATDSGIWADDSGGTRELVAQTGESAPGTSGALFLAFSPPVYNDGSAVAFLSTLAGSGVSADVNDAGVWSTSGGTLALVARRGGQAPGYPTGVTFLRFNGFALPDVGGVLLLATVKTTTNSRGIWAGHSTADLQLLLKEGDSVNGKKISSLSFLPALSYVNGQTRSFAQGTGVLVCGVTYSDSSTGIIEVDGATSQVVAQSGDAAAGVTGGVFSAFGNAAVSGSGYVAFRASLAIGPGGVTAANKSGVWADDNTGTRQLVVRTGVTAPGTTSEFAALNDPVYNDNEAVAFRATLTGGGVTAISAVGVWSNSGGALALVARKGLQAPGCPTGVTFRGFTSLALPDQGGVIFLGTLNLNSNLEVTSANDGGIWAVDTSGNLQLIVRKGQVFNGKTITGLSFLPILAHVGGQTRNFNQSTGDLVYEATFSDKTSAIVEVQFQ